MYTQTLEIVFFLPSSGIHKHTVHIGYQDGNNWEHEREPFLSRFATYYLCYDQRKIKYIIKRIIFDTITTK